LDDANRAALEETLGGEKVAPVDVERVTVWTVDVAEADPEADPDPEADALPDAAEVVDVPEEVVDEDVVELEALEVEETVEIMVNYPQLAQAQRRAGLMVTYTSRKVVVRSNPVRLFSRADWDTHCSKKF